MVDDLLFDPGLRSDSPEFRLAVREHFDRLYPDESDEDLLCNPAEAVRFCDSFRSRFGADGASDEEILGALQNLRKKGGHPFGKKRTRIDLAAELRVSGCLLDVDTFCDRITEMLQRRHPAWSDEQMLRHPTESQDFCRAVRKQVRAKSLPDTLILYALVYVRKNKRREPTDRVGAC